MVEIVYVLERIYKYTENYKKVIRKKSEIENATVILEAL